MTVKDMLYILDVSPLEEEALFKKWYGRMSDDRKKKIDAMKPISGKLLSLGAGVLLYTAMENAGSSDYELAEGEHGKPFIKGREDAFFNLSHSGRMVVLAISDKEVGVDVEKNQFFKDSLISYVFSTKETALAKEISKDFRDFDAEDLQPSDLAYTRLWTVKESIMKYSGLGITLEPKMIEIYSDDSRPGTLLAKSDSYDCTGLQLFCFARGDYQITVCSRKKDIRWQTVII